MNKRIRKKRARLSPFRIGDHTYSMDYINNLFRREVITLYMLPKLRIAYKGKVVLRKTGLKRSLKSMCKRIKREQYMSYKHLKFARHLHPIPDFTYKKTPIIGGEHIKYKSSVIINFTKNSKEE